MRRIPGLDGEFASDQPIQRQVFVCRVDLIQRLGAPLQRRFDVERAVVAERLQEFGANAADPPELQQVVPFATAGIDVVEGQFGRNQVAVAAVPAERGPRLLLRHQLQPGLAIALDQPVIDGVEAPIAVGAADRVLHLVHVEWLADQRLRGPGDMTCRRRRMAGFDVQQGDQPGIEVAPMLARAQRGMALW